jgi:hypothetical protein
MSFLDCINNAEEEGTINSYQARRARNLFEKFRTENARKMSDAESDAQASRDAFDALEFDVLEGKRRTALSAQVTSRAMNDVLSFRGKYIGEGLSHILKRDGSGRAEYADVYSRQQGILAISHAKLEQVLTKMSRTRVLGRQRLGFKAQSRDLVKEIFGENSNNASAREMAMAWKEVAEMLRLRFNNAGGSIPKRIDWGATQAHDPSLIRSQGGFPVWKKDIEDWLDWGKMVSNTTNKVIPESERKDFLEEIFDTIMTQGMNKVNPSSIAGKGRSLARRRADHRFLAFKGPKEWLAYQQKYGGGDIFQIMMNHIETMSRDIAMMEIMGPNPNSTAEFLKTQLRSMAKEADINAPKPKNVSALNKEINTFDEIMGEMSGSSLVPVNETQSRVWASLGEMLSAAQLGSTSILALLSDTGTARMVSRIGGLPHAKILPQAVKTLMASNLTKSELIRAGMIAENWSSTAYGQARYIGDLMGSQLTQRISNAAMNWSLLSPITQAERWSFQQSMIGHFSEVASKKFAELTSENRDLLKKYGIDETDWEKLRNVRQYQFKPKWSRKSVGWLRPTDVFEVDEALAFKYLDMIQSETDIAIPVSNPRAMAAVRLSKPGTIRGDLGRSIAQYKTFPVVLYQNNLKQIAHLNKGATTRIGYAGEFLVTSTLLAAMAVQIREIVKGRDPLTMFDEEGKPNLKFWGQAVLAGGGLGLFGDFLFSNVNRFGSSLGESIAGPRVGFLDDIKDLTVGNVAEVLEGKETGAGVEAVEFMARYAPGVSNFYTRLVIERMILDRLRLWADPKAEQRFRLLERGRQRDWDQEYWWRLGDVEGPSRAPDLGAIVKEARSD